MTESLIVAFGGLLSTHVFEVDVELLRFAQERVAIGFDRENAIAGVHEVDHVRGERTG